MFAKVWASSLLVLALCLQVTAHASVSPIFGVPGAATRSDVRKPTTANPCGAGVNIVSEFKSSTAATADASGSVQLNATCYNGGTDGSLLFKAQVDPTGTGEHFVTMDITTNGPNSPPGAESLPITVQLPSGIRCTGGSGNQCLAQFISGAGFGNCVVISQSAAAGPTSTTAAGGSAPSISTTGGNPPSTKSTTAGRNPTTSTAASCRGKTAVDAGSAGAAYVPASGSLLARSLLADLRNRGEGAIEIAKRGSSGWMY